jgi:hypothetical protein
MIVGRFKLLPEKGSTRWEIHPLKGVQKWWRIASTLPDAIAIAQEQSSWSYLSMEYRESLLKQYHLWKFSLRVLLLPIWLRIQLPTRLENLHNAEIRTMSPEEWKLRTKGRLVGCQVPRGIRAGSGLSDKIIFGA